MKKIGLYVSLLCSRLAGRVKATWPAAAAPCLSDELARIRLFGLKARPLVLVMAAAQGMRSFVKVDGASAADAQDARAAQGQMRLGVAHTAGRCDPRQTKRIFSIVCYWEFLVPGGKPLQIGSAAGAMRTSSPIALTPAAGLSARCGRTSDVVGFTPQCGKDYQVDICTNDGVCTVTVHEVRTSAGATRLVPIALD